MANPIVRLPPDEFRAGSYKTIPTPFFLLKTKKNALKNPRLGIVIGKSAYKEAVKRNFWKRQTRELFLKNAHGGIDILIIFTSGSKGGKAKLTKKQFKEDLVAAIQKIK